MTIETTEEQKELMKRIYDDNYINIISVSGGKDSTALLLTAIELGVKFEAVFADTGHENQLTYEYLDYLEKSLGITIRRIKADFQKKIERKRLYIINNWEKKGVSKEQVEEALAVLYPTGIPMLDVALWKGRFSSRINQFCTHELKVKPMIEQVYEPIWDSGKEAISWQGIRRAESKRRAEAAIYEETPDGFDIYRPLVEWSARDVFDMHDKYNIDPNPLYKMGMKRVGCEVCINETKNSLYEIARRFPEAIEKLDKWEKLVGKASKIGKATFFTIDALQGDGIKERVEWSKTKYGGRELDPEKLEGMFDIPTCSSNYGLCE